MKTIASIVLLLVVSCAVAQPTVYSMANVHVHNDYEKPFPFREAWLHTAGSIEADIFLTGGELLVAHEPAQLALHRTLDSLYLQPLNECIRLHKGFVYADTMRQLQLMIDIKSAAIPTLAALVDKLRAYPLITGSRSVRIVISGSRPPSSTFASYPGFISFDGDLLAHYTPAQLERIDMLSADFKKFSRWNGKGRVPSPDHDRIMQAISKAHDLKKKVRFWNAPDILNTWYAMMRLGVDYINTDKIAEVAGFIKQLPYRRFTAHEQTPLYNPSYRNDNGAAPPRNIILIIGDGTGLAQWYAAYTANKGALNVFNMKYTGFSKTSSYDNYITDSAPGATAFSSGKKTNNRAVGVDHTGKAIALLPAMLQREHMKTGIITTGDITDATPASFYAHRQERSQSAAILRDLLHAPVDIIMGKGSPAMNDSLAAALSRTYVMLRSVDSVQPDLSRKWMVLNDRAGLPADGGRDSWASEAFDKAISVLSEHKTGFFLVLEGAQPDHGAHANQLPWMVNEVLDLDRVIGKAMEFADHNGETLVVVTADHETGGLSLTDGDYITGYIAGQFATDDHTAVPVPVFAYGPRAGLFTGVYENTAIFYKILEAFGKN